jgi:thiosulfate/3-mercaptopyruvate sulfurtransferase
VSVGGPLVAVAQLAEELRSQAPPVLLDVRWKVGAPPGQGRELWLQGHIPGAGFVDLDRDLAAPPGPDGRHPLPDPELFAVAMRRAGVRSDRGVVLYDADTGIAAARGWWLLRFHGHPSVCVLDGGLNAWQAAGEPVEAGEIPISQGDFRTGVGAAGTGGSGMPAIDAGGAQALARRGVLLDARAGERYRGEVEPIDRVAGHIPGARSAPALDSMDAQTGRFRDAARLTEQFAAVGAVPGVEVAAYCGSGVQAAHAVLALELAGIPAALYVGSWSNWIADPTRPVATGAAPG